MSRSKHEFMNIDHFSQDVIIFTILINFNRNILKLVKDKWSEKLNLDINLETAIIYLHKFSKDFYVKIVQLKMIHYRVITNSLLMKIGLKEELTCPFCDGDYEIIVNAL